MYNDAYKLLLLTTVSSKEQGFRILSFSVYDPVPSFHRPAQGTQACNAAETNPVAHFSWALLRSRLGCELRNTCVKFRYNE
jgi:hypothetical protein